MCSIFMLNSPQGPMVGRNFDWAQKGGTVHIIPRSRVYGARTLGMLLIEQMGSDRPYEGVNEKGLFMAMAAVYPVPEVSERPDGPISMNELGVMRFILERAASSDEALKMIKQFRIDYAYRDNYPRVHYMIADVDNIAVLYEEDVNETRALMKPFEWMAITNFSVNSGLECPRYRVIEEHLNAHSVTDSATAAELLKASSTDASNVYSAVYNLSTLDVSLYIDRDYSHPHSFNLLHDLGNGLQSVDFGELKNKAGLLDPGSGQA